MLGYENHRDQKEKVEEGVAEDLKEHENRRTLEDSEWLVKDAVLEEQLGNLDEAEK